LLPARCYPPRSSIIISSFCRISSFTFSKLINDINILSRMFKVHVSYFQIWIENFEQHNLFEIFQIINLFELFPITFQISKTINYWIGIIMICIFDSNRASNQLFCWSLNFAWHTRFMFEKEYLVRDELLSQFISRKNHQ
jgi:hypothetical protein